MAEIAPWLSRGALALLLPWAVVELWAWRRGGNVSAEGDGRPNRIARVLLLSSAALLLAVLLWRGVEVGFLPLTSKYESFLGFALILLGTLAGRHPKLAEPGRLLLGVTAAATLIATLFFDDALRYPSPLLYTGWYAAHVPLSFAGYALWLAAAGDGVDRLAGRITDAELEERQESDVRWGFVLFSAAMIFGAIWGLVSWGVYFLWDAKIVWSLAAWLYFATLMHLRYWPVRRSGPRVALGAIGYAVVAITYVGTSFMSGSIHSF